MLTSLQLQTNQTQVHAKIVKKKQQQQKQKKQAK